MARGANTTPASPPPSRRYAPSHLPRYAVEDFPTLTESSTHEMEGGVAKRRRGEQPQEGPHPEPVEGRGPASPLAHPEAGFSLIEVMVVLLIIGLASAIVVMTAPPGAPSLEREADRLATRLAAARDLALIENRTVLIELTAEGYAQRIRTFQGWSTPPNTPDQSSWESGTTLSHQSGRLPAAIMFDSIGLTEPTTLTLIRDGRTAIIDIDAAGHVTREGA